MFYPKSPLGNVTSPEGKKTKETKALLKLCLTAKLPGLPETIARQRGTLVRMTFLSLSMSGMVSKSLSSTELSVSDWHGWPPSGEDICLPGLELDPPETENAHLPS